MRCCVPAIIAALTMMNSLAAQQGYRLPPQSIVDVVDAAPAPGTSLSPDGRWVVFLERRANPPIEDLARRMLRLAGMRIDPAANGPFRTDYFHGLRIRGTFDTGEGTAVPFPEGTRVASLGWSHRSNALAIATVSDSGSTLWVVRPEQPASPVQLMEGLSTIFGFVDWSPEGDELLCHRVPPGRGPEPPQPTVPMGPNVQESVGNTSPVRTYQDLLASDHDEQLFEYFATAELVRVGLDGSVSVVGQPAMYTDASYSPDGNFLLVNELRRPFSRLMTWGSFPQATTVRTRTGDTVFTVVESPMAENIPIEGVPVWRRSIQWRPDQPASLLWAEALDGGDPRNKVSARDRLVSLPAPFTGEPAEVCRVEHRYRGAGWIQDPPRMLVSEYDRDRRWIRTLMHDTSSPGSEPAVLFDRSIRDRYGDPGRPLTEPSASGYSFVICRNGQIWLAGDGATPEGDLPFLDRMNLATRQTERLWRCEKGTHETLVSLLQNEAGIPERFITSHETPVSPPNLQVRSLDGSLAGRLTDFPDPTPQIRGIRKELVKYARADGVPLSATMYLPEGWQPGQRLPLLVWAYPLEFSDAATAGQVSGSPWEFTRISGISHLALVLAGYAVMDDATMPVIGDPETMNDTFVEQIVGAAQAAIDHAVAMGVADRHRVAVGGHSYGAFMTANLLAHSSLFRAGIARSGAYNRTLTPFGFQAERRPYWEAREVYEKVSPFTWANQIRTPLLLIHGEADNNPGTFPIQSERMFQAVKGNGGTVRLVTLPLESHGYRARESVLHTQAEMLDWLDRFVRNAQPPDLEGG